MISISDPCPNRTCAGYSRRNFLRIGSLGLGGLSLPGLLSTKAAAENSNVLRGKSVVLLFLHGGPPHIEFFDPNSLEPAKRIRRGTHMALAVFFGKTRLIDNSRL